MTKKNASANVTVMLRMADPRYQSLERFLHPTWPVAARGSLVPIEHAMVVVVHQMLLHCVGLILKQLVNADSPDTPGVGPGLLVDLGPPSQSRLDLVC